MKLSSELHDKNKDKWEPMETEFSNAYGSKHEKNLGRDFVKDHKDFIELK